jgi:hypothetical protein
MHVALTKANIKRAESCNLNGITAKKLYRSLTMKRSEIAICGNTQTVSLWSNLHFLLKSRFQVFFVFDRWLIASIY